MGWAIEFGFLGLVWLGFGVVCVVLLGAEFVGVDGWRGYRFSWGKRLFIRECIIYDIYGIYEYITEYITGVSPCITGVSPMYQPVSVSVIAPHHRAMVYFSGISANPNCGTEEY